MKKKFNKNIIFSALLGLGVFALSTIKDNLDSENTKKEQREWMKEEIALQISNLNEEES